jgi:hypothetical protein
MREEQCWNLVEVASGRIRAVAVSPATSMQTALDTQYPRSPILASRRQAVSSSQIQRGIDCSVILSCGEAERPKGARGGRRIERHKRGSRGSERAELWNGRGRRE